MFVDLSSSSNGCTTDVGTNDKTSETDTTTSNRLDMEEDEQNFHVRMFILDGVKCWKKPQNTMSRT